MKKSKRASTRVEWKEKLYESDSSLEWRWESDDESDLPSLKAISMTSLDVADGLESEPLRVRFSADIDCQPYLHILNYTKEESDGCFYTEDERASMSSSREDIIAQIDGGMIDRHEEELIRGLEYWCVSSSTEIDRRVDSMIERVMDEQDDQIDANILDNDALAFAAQDITAESTQVAQQNAAKDALMAREAYLQMGNVLPRGLLQLDKRQHRRRTSMRRSSIDMHDTAALADAADEDKRKRKKKKKEKIRSTDKKEKKKAKRKKRSSSLLYKDRKGVKSGQNKPSSDDTDMEKQKSDKSVASSKKSRSSKKKNRTKALKKRPSSKKIKAQMRSSERTLVTEAETSIEGTVVKQITESSLSSEEGERFLQTTKRQSKSQSRERNHRHTLSGPASRKAIKEIIGDDDDDDDDRPDLTRSFSWWNL